MILNKQNKKYGNITAGFTLTELLVTIAVFMLLSTVVLANFRSVDNSLILRNVAHQVALIIRKAQIQGISALGVDTAMTGDFNYSYGVNFNMGANDTFNLFVDRNGNERFGGPCSGGPECVQKYTLFKNYTISDLCGINGTGTTCGLGNLNILFTRPNPDACLRRDVGPPSCATGGVYSSARVVVKSLSGSTATITIWKTGQISIE